MLFTASLHAQGERGAAGHSRSECATRPVAIAIAHGRRMRHGISERDRREQVVLEPVGDDVSHVRKLTQVTGTSGCVAPGHHDLNVGVAARNSPHRLTRALIGCRGDGAGIHNDEIGLLGRSAHGTSRSQGALDAQRVGLVYTTAKGNDGVLHTGSAFLPMSRRYCMPSK